VAASYKAGSSSQARRLFLCAVVVGAQCTSGKTVFEQHLLKDVDKLAKANRINISTTSLSVSTTSIEMVRPGGLRAGCHRV
jgi:hypothetical protein